MAGVPCVTDTCSVTAAVDANGRLSLAARLAAAGGIVCGTDGDPNAGLRVDLFGDPAAVSAATLNACDNLLGVTTDGKLFARRPQYELLNVSGASVNFPSGGTSAYSTNVTITNNAACARLLIVKTRFIYRFSTNDDTAYINNGHFELDAGTHNQLYFWEVGGGAPSGSPTENIQSLNECTVDFVTVPASSAAVIRARGTRGIEVAPGNTHDEEFQAHHQILLLDMAAGDLFA